MTETPDNPSMPDGQPRPTPRPRPASTGRPSPRARIAGARRDRDEASTTGAQPTARRTGAAPVDAGKAVPVDAEKAAPGDAGKAVPVDAGKAVPVDAEKAQAAPLADAAPLAEVPAPPAESEERQPAPRARREHARAVADAAPAGSRRGIAAVAAALAVLCLLAAAGTGALIWQRLHPSSVDPSVFSAARSEVQALYAFDYKDASNSVARKLDALTGTLRDEYKKDLQGAVIDTYKQVSATTSYDVLDIGLQQINDAQNDATVVVFGQYVVKSVTTANQKAPTGSECQATADGGQSCTQTLNVELVKVKGAWKIKNVTVITSS